MTATLEILKTGPLALVEDLGGAGCDDALVGRAQCTGHLPADLLELALLVVGRQRLLHGSAG